MKTDESGLLPVTLKSLKLQEIEELTDIQSACIPHALKRQDIFAQAPTSSGKTLAYLLPILNLLEPQTSHRHVPQALILCPSRELAMQTASEARKLLSNREGIRTAVLTGGCDIQKQIRSFSGGADIVVGTPGRIQDHLRRHTLKTKQCGILVLDEADEMLSMGFQDAVESIIETLPEHQTMLFSATYSNEVKDLASAVLKDPFTVKMNAETVHRQILCPYYVFCEEKKKPDILQKLLKQNQNIQILVFCNTRRTCDFVCSLLNQKGFAARAIHSEMEQRDRTEIMKNFRDGSLKILCATDVAARGLDLPGVDLVINYDYPEESSFYLHRIGRAGRREKAGTAITFLKQDERNRLQEMKQMSRQEPQSLPGNFHKI